MQSQVLTTIPVGKKVRLIAIQGERILSRRLLSLGISLCCEFEVVSLRGKGVVPVRGGTAGDLMCKVVVETPVNLSNKQKELLRKFQESLESGGNRHNPRKNNWFEGVKRFFDTK